MRSLDFVLLVDELCTLLEEYIPDPSRHPVHDKDRARVAQIRTRILAFEAEAEPRDPENQRLDDEGAALGKAFMERTAAMVRRDNP